MNSFFKFVFPVFFAVVFIAAIAIMGVSAWLSVQCYLSGDTNSMACYMINDRADVTIRQR